MRGHAVLDPEDRVQLVRERVGLLRFPLEARLGFNAAWVRDNRSHTNTTETALNQRVFSGDWALPVWGGLRLYGESAFSRTDSEVPSVDEDLVPILTANSIHGWDHWGHADFSWRRFKTANDVERVDNKYATAAGASSPDLFRVTTKNTLNLIGAWKWVVLNYTYFHDNVARVENGVTNTTRMPESGLRYDGPDWRPTFSFEAKVR